MPNYTVSRCDDGGHYYIVEFTAVGELGKVVWAGADDEGRFANVFFGRYERGSQLYERFSGEWWDVPLGQGRSNGTLEVEVGTRNAGLITQTGGFGGRIWYQLNRELNTPTIDHQIPLRPGRYADSNNLTGYWRSAESGAQYYIREDGDNIVWLAAREDGSAANVFKGRRIDEVISGEWIDIPLGATRSHGRVSFRIIGDGDDIFALRRSERNSSYGTRTIIKVDQ